LCFVENERTESLRFETAGKATQGQVGARHQSRRRGDDGLADLTPERMRGIGLRITAAPLVNAIPAVCAATSGIATYAGAASVVNGG
jgi:hypothetical protein